METGRKEWEEYKDFTEDHLIAMALKKYNNLLTSGMWSTKYLKDSQILALVGVAQKLVDGSKK